MELQLILVLLLALSVGLISYAILYNPQKFAIQDNVKKLYGDIEMDSLFDTAMKDRAEKKRLADYVKVSDRFRNEIESADLAVTASEFLVLWMAAALAPILLIMAVNGNWIVASGAGMAGFIIPIAVFKKKQNDRVSKFGDQLGDALITICNGIRSGFSFQQAMRSVANDMPDPISTEFNKALTEMDYGVTQNDALLHMNQRLHNEDLAMLISSLEVTQKTGGNLSEVLDTISNTVKERIKIREDVKTLSAQGKMSSIIIGGLPIGLLIMIMTMNPDYIEPMLASSTGKVVLTLAACMEVAGFIIMNKITDVKL